MNYTKEDLLSLTDSEFSDVLIEINELKESLNEKYSDKECTLFSTVRHAENIRKMKRLMPNLRKELDALVKEGILDE